MSALGKMGAWQRWLLLYAALVLSVAAILVWLLPSQWMGSAGAAAGGLIAAGIVIRVASGRLRQRVHQLREAADALANGHMVEQIRDLPHDDFLKLSQSVDRLAAHLRDLAAERDQLRRSLGRSEELAVMGELAATVAHEVNNPLDGLQNSVRILRRRLGGDEQIARLLDMMEAGLDRIEATVQRLLRMSRDEPIHPAPVAASALVEDALLFVQPRLNRHGIRLVRDCPETPVVLLVDDAHMAQALINLMINAADAMGEAGGTLTIRCRASGADRASLEVVDTGTGIPEEHLPHIFDAFYSTKVQGSGTGLGLSVAKRIIEAHQGRIEVHTELGKGTCFRLELPAVAQGDLNRSPDTATVLPELTEARTRKECGTRT